MRPFTPPHFQVTTVSKFVFFMVVFLSCGVLAVADLDKLHAQTPQPGAGSFSEREAQGIDRMIMCPVCPAETIDQAQVQIAKQMRQVVRDMLAEGKERQEILEFFVERYGQDILGAPPKSGTNLVAWLAPVGGVGAGLLAVYFILRSMTRREPPLVQSWPVQDVALIPYLRLVDRYLDMTRSRPGPSGTFNQVDSSVDSPSTEIEDQERNK